jgi:phosphatidylglycerophosphate synthase
MALAVHDVRESVSMTVYSARDVFRVPGLLSLSRLPLAVVFALTVGRTRWALAALLVAGLSDVLDGWVARRFGQVTPTGAVLDAVMDKVFVAAVVVALIASHTLSFGQALLLGVRDLGELAIGVRLALAGRSRLTRPHPALTFGKVTTLLQYVACAAAVLRSADVPAVAVATAFTGALATAEYWANERRPV